MSATDDLKTGSDIDADRAVVKPGTSPLLHPDPTCKCAQKIKRPRLVRVENYPNNVVCKVCLGVVTNTGGTRKGLRACLTCGDQLMPDGTCKFCERWDEVMGD